ncbi:hypothetical protein FZC66_05475 [Priestia megaterium]|nr:hypothetical protein FZC66_05475 [Priestia megaterium]
MTINYIEGTERRKGSICGLISILIPTVTAIFVLNFLLAVVPIPKMEGLPLIFPIFLCPIGLLFAFIGYIQNKDGLSLLGIILNLILFLFPIVYHIFGTLLFGP